MSILTKAGMFLAALMVACYLLVSHPYISKRKGSWPGVQKLYKGLMLGAYAVVVIGVGASIALHVGVLNARPSPSSSSPSSKHSYSPASSQTATTSVTQPGTHPAENNSSTASGAESLTRIEQEYINFLADEGMIPLIVSGFFAAIVRFFLDDVIIKGLEKPRGWLKDAWLWWFVMMVVVECLFERLHLREHKTLNAIGGVILMWVVNLVVVVSFWLWIFVAMFRTLAESEGFRGPAVTKFILSPWKEFVLRQAVVIGPKRSGKTTLVRSVAPLANTVAISAAPLPTPVLDGGKMAGTLLNEFREFATLVNVNGNRSTVLVSIVDCPGENLGDHVSLPYRYRTDVLVLVLMARHLKDGDVLTAHDNYRLDTFSRCCDGSADGRKAQEYLTALHLATTRDNSDRKEDARVPRELLLVLNYDREDHREQSVANRIRNDGNLKQLAIDIGLRFSISEDRCATIIEDVRQSTTFMIAIAGGV
jgi:hypothetical protein